MSNSSWIDKPPEPPAEPTPGLVRMAIPLYKPQWSYIILGTIVLISVLVEVLGFDALLNYGAKINAAIAAGQWWRLLTAMFLHAGIWHLFFNVYALFQLGPETERLFNRERFLVIYFLSGLYAGLASYAFTLAPSVGASGAVFGLVGALIAYMRRYREIFGRFGQQYLVNMLVIVGINFVLGFVQPGIDNWAHFGGLVAGFIIGTLLLPRYAPPAYMDEHVLRDVSSRQRVWLVALVGLLGVAAGVLLVTALLNVGF